MVTYNPDGSEFDDSWHCQLIGDTVVVYDHGQEVSRHPRWMQPLLLQQHKANYEAKYAGRGK